MTEDEREAAETTLLAEAPRLSLRDLRARGDRISEVFRATPAEADADEEAIVRKREARARAVTELWIRDLGDGTYKGGFTIPALQGEILKTLLDAVASPRREHLRNRLGNASEGTTGTGNSAGAFGRGFGSPNSAGTDRGVETGAGDRRASALVPDQRSYPQKLGQAFCALIEHTPTDGYPRSGGSAAVVAVSLSHEKLVSGAGCGPRVRGCG